MKKCPKCGSKIRTDSAFCENCGVRLSSGKFLKLTKRKSHKKLWISVALIAVCVLGSLIALLNPFQKEKNQVTVASAEEAINLLKEMGQEYGIENGLSELTEKYTAVIDGDSYYRLQQNYQGIPVYGRTVVCAADASGQVISLTGNIADIPEDIVLNPAVSYNQIIESVRMYLTENLGVKNVDSLDISEPGQENVCIYNMGDMEEASLAYCINVGAYEIVVDAENGAVLNACPTVYSANESLGMVSAIGYMASDEMRENGFNIIKCTDTYYIMKDAARNISVYALDGNLFKDDNLIWPERAVLVESSDEIFGNTETEAALAYETGAKLLLNVARISDYFEQLGFTASGAGTYLYYNDGYDQGQNAQGGYVDLFNTGEKYGVISMGTVTGVNDLDVICHEYTHRVSHQLIGFSGGSEQTGAIDEGLSDIFGELLEALIFRETDTPDWVMLGDNISVRRNIANPRETGNLETASDEYDGNNPRYAYSTVISHAAYLMWNGIDGSNAKKISAENLAKLWYRAMLLMPADCDFAACRRMVELAALSVNGLTETQRECIAEAFDMVGIEAEELPPEIAVDCDYNVHPNSVLKVYDVNGNLHPNYTLSISGTIAERELAYSSNIRTDIGYRYEKTTEIKKASSHRLDLPDGYYAFSITDSNNPQYTYSFTVSVSDNGTDDTIELYTDFEDRLLVKITEETTQTETDKQLTQANAYFDGGICWQTNLNYNENGLLAGYTQDSYSTDREIHYSYAFTYNADGKLTQSQEIMSGYPCSKYYYDSEGKMTSWNFWEYSSAYGEVYTCEYNTSGQRIRDKSTDGNKETLYFYDDMGRLISESSRCVYGDMSCTVETTMSYDKDGNLSEKTVASDWGFGSPSVEKFVYNYDYKPFATVTVYSDGNLMYSSLRYEDMVTGEVISFTIDDTAEFETEDGYLVRVTGEDYEYDFFYDGATDTSFASRIPVPSYEDELTGSYLAEYEAVKIIITATNNSDYHLTYITSEVTLENIPLAYFNINTDTDKRLMFDVDACYPEYNGYIEVIWSKNGLFQYAYNAMIEGLTDTEADYSPLKKVGVFVPAN